MDYNKEFNALKRYYQDNDFTKIFEHQLGIYFLKLRSISRAIILSELADHLDIDITEVQGRELFEFLFCKSIPIEEIDAFIKLIYERERKERVKSEDSLYSELYKLKVFDWGGFYQNAVEQTIVNNYIKNIQNYEQLCDCIENEINPRLRGYILCSWYNHWTSILIEDMFRDHSCLLPAVGLIKKIDFFWNDFPFDLKVTYFPEGFMRLKRADLNLRPELTELKAFARQYEIPYDRSAKDNEIFIELLTRISEDPSKEAKIFIKDFHRIRRKIISDTIDNPTELIIWFYEQQGIRRFDAANRFFLVLIELDNLEESWKLKRNKKLLFNEINQFLDNNKNIDFDEMKISFGWQDTTYTTYATALFVIKQ